MLLREEEISLALRNQGYTDEVYPELEVVAKAQLKKVVEWGDGHCSLLEHGDNAKWPIPRKHCLECWQVLLEEVK